MSGVLAIASAVRMGAISAGAVAEAALAALARGDPAIGAVTRITADRARAEAAAVDAAIAAGRDPGPLAGVPYGVKDLFDITGVPTTAGSALYADAPPAAADATAVQRLCAAGAVLVATLNMDEFAYGFATINARHGTTRNPHDVARLAGGSSGGSAAVVAAGLLHTALSTFVGRIRFALPPLITGLVVLMIGLSLMRVGIQYSAGGVPAQGTPAYGAGISWLLAAVVVVSTVGLKFFGRGIWSSAAVLLGLLAGYGLALALGRVSFDPVAHAGWVMVPMPFHFGFAISASAILGFCLTGFVSSIESIGDVCAICENNAGRPATDRELIGAVSADGVGTALAAVFGAMPNTTFSQNVGLIAITGVMSRHIVTLGAIFLVLCGLAPKVGALVTTIPIEVLGGGVIVMFGMVASSAISMLAGVTWNQRNMLIFGVALSLSLGLQMEPDAVGHLPETARILLTSGVLPAAFVGILLNLIIPEEAV